MRALGRSNASRRSSTVISCATFDKSGPVDSPRPPTMWQVAHCPWPKKNCSPYTAPPGTERSAEDTFNECNKAAKATSRLAERLYAGTENAGFSSCDELGHLGDYRPRALRR